jgi:hypothetical protein
MSPRPASRSRLTRCPSRAGQARFARRGRDDFLGGAPECRDRRGASGEIPYCRGDRAARASNAGHLGCPSWPVGHQVHHELGRSTVKGLVGPGERFGDTATHVDAWHSLTRCRHERLRRVDRADAVSSELRDEDRGQRTRTASDVEYTLPGRQAQPGGEPPGERSGKPAHELVVGVGRNGEGHANRPYRTPHPGQAMWPGCGLPASPRVVFALDKDGIIEPQTRGRSAQGWFRFCIVTSELSSR